MDKEIVSKLAQEDYSAWLSKMQKVLNQPDTPIDLKNRIWSVRSENRLELWQELGPRLFDNHLDTFRESAVSVLSERDPQFDLIPEERYSAGIKGKTLTYSSKLRKGLAESLALLGSYPDALEKCSQNKPEYIANITVQEIFDNADWKLWASLNSILPLLAEASPKMILSAIDTALRSTPCPFDELFSQEGKGLFGDNYLTGVLWSLETLAWDEQYLVQVTVLLGELASRDPGGNYGNRPANSLSTIFLPWLTQTTASLEKRKVAIQTLQKEVPDAAWKLLIRISLKQNQMAMYTHKPKWRKMIPDEGPKKVTNKEYWDQVESYSEMAVEMAKGDVARLSELIGHLDNLPQSPLNKFLEYLSSKEISGMEEDHRTELWSKLVDHSTKHIRHAKSDVDPKLVARIQDITNTLAPTNPMNLYRRLFVTRDLELYEERGNWREEGRILEDKRQHAIMEILGKFGLESVIEFAETTESPYKVGFPLGFIAGADVDERILPSMLGVENTKLTNLANGYVRGRYQSQGWKWVDAIDMTGWSRMQIGQFLTFLPFTYETWKRSRDILGEVEKEYWGKAGVNHYEEDRELDLAVNKLIKYGRPNAAIYCLSFKVHEKKPFDKALAVKALLVAVSSTEPSTAMDSYHIVDIIKALQDDDETNQDDLFSVEWAYLQLLERDQGASPKLLENRLASDHSFFCEVIRLIYRSKKDKEEKKEPSEAQQSIAANAYHLLYNWHTPPGLQPDGSFSGNEINVWLESTKQECEESGHLGVALSHIGNVLIHCPSDPDGLWIHRAAAEALNEKEAEEMRGGFSSAVFNSRGVHWVDPTGKPERDFAAEYNQKAEDVENAGYQRLAGTLRNLAESYNKQAEQINSEHKDEDTGL